MTFRSVLTRKTPDLVLLAILPQQIFMTRYLGKKKLRHGEQPYNYIPYISGGALVARQLLHM